MDAKEDLLELLKTLLEKWKGSLNEILNTFLFTYRITPQSTAGISPAELLMNKKINSKLNIIELGAELGKNVFLSNVSRQIKKGDEVWIRDFSIGNRYREQCCVLQVPYLIRG